MVLFSWLLTPSAAVAENAEIGFAIALIVSTAAVVVGLVGEYRKRGWWLRRVRLAEMLVLFGVAAEMVAEAGAFIYSERLKSIEDAAVSQANTRAGDALASAQSIGLTFDNLHTFVDAKQLEAAAQMDTFRGTAAALKSQADDAIAKLNADKHALEKARDEAVASAAEAGAALSAARAAATRLAAAVASIKNSQQEIDELTTPRTISIGTVAQKLNKFGRVPFVIALSDDHDAIDLAGQIATALEAAGWDWQDNKASDNSFEIGKQFTGKPMMRIQSALGILVEIPGADADALEAPAQALNDALIAEKLRHVEYRGLGTYMMNAGKKLPGVVHILVGTRG